MQRSVYGKQFVTTPRRNAGLYNRMEQNLSDCFSPKLLQSYHGALKSLECVEVGNIEDKKIKAFKVLEKIYK